MSEPWRALIVKHFPLLAGKHANEDGWISVNCPIHPTNDTSQTGGLNVESGRFLCHSDLCRRDYLSQLDRPTDRARSISLAELFHFIHGWPLPEALSIVDSYRVDRLDSDFAHDDSTHSGVNGETILNYFSTDVSRFVSEASDRLADDFDDIDIAVDYAASRGLSKQTLVDIGTGYVPPRTDLPDGTTSGVQGCLLFPYWFKQKLVGVRIRQADSRKRMLRGSHYIPYNLNDVFDTTSRVVVVGEGESDVIRLRQLLTQHNLENVPVVGTPGLSFDQKWSRFFRRFNRVIAVPQADRPSQKQFVGELRQTFDSRLEIVQIPWEEDAFGGKDICDYLLSHDRDREAELVDLFGVSIYDAVERPYLKLYDYFTSRENKTVDWLIPNVVESGSKVLVVGDPKVGKTFLALGLMESVIRGTPFLQNPDWAPTRSGLKCLLVEEEGSERALTQRILTIIPPTDKLGVIHGEGVKLDDPMSFDRLKREALAFRPDLIILDPYASLHNQDENTVEGTMLVMRSVNILYRALPGTTIVILHHRAKGGGGARGSGSLWGAVDYQLTLSRGDTRRKVGLTIEGREVEESDTTYFDFDPDHMTFSPSDPPPPSVNLVSRDKSTPFRSDIEQALQQATQPLSTNDLVDQIPNAGYSRVYKILGELVSEGLAQKHGNGGRAGYTYTWSDSSS